MYNRFNLGLSAYNSVVSTNGVEIDLNKIANKFNIKSRDCHENISATSHLIKKNQSIINYLSRSYRSPICQYNKIEKMDITIKFTLMLFFGVFAIPAYYIIKHIAKKDSQCYSPLIRLQKTLLGCGSDGKMTHSNLNKDRIIEFVEISENCNTILNKTGTETTDMEKETTYMEKETTDMEKETTDMEKETTAMEIEMTRSLSDLAKAQKTNSNSSKM